ncbi:MAG TPA: NADPH:quinone oxidoreductase family protein [Sphingomonadales bacterium]
MKAIVCKAFGGPENLALEERPCRRPEAGEVRIRVHRAAVNFADLLMIAGQYQVQPRPPFVPGLEAAGEVIETGAGVATLRPGDRVVALMSDGAFATEMCGPESRFLRVPHDMDHDTAAAFSVTCGTAHMGLVRRARIQPGEWLVVTGAGGGAGLAAVELGKILGARVIAAAGSADKLELAASRGADHLIDYRKEDLRARILDITGGAGAHVLFDPVGGDVFRAGFRALRFEGRAVIVGFASGAPAEIRANHLLVKNIDLIGLYWGGYKVHAIDALRASAEEIIALWRQGRIRPHVDAVLPLARTAEALDLVRSRRSRGKILIRMA